MSDHHQLLKAILRQDLYALTRKVFETLSPGIPFLPNWHIEAIAHQLERVQVGETRRLLITQPPRSLKSICTSVAFVAWALGHNPAQRFICVSYSDELAEEFARMFRKVVNSAWYRDLFPAMRIERDTASEVLTTRGGGRITTSVGGTLRGRGGDVIIIDDPMKAAESASESELKRVIDWYRLTLVSRLNNQSTGAIIVVMQRLHERDLAGYLTEGGGWETLELPAIATRDQPIPLGNGRVHHRRIDEVLHPAQVSREQLEQLQAEIGSRAFSAQYQQQPVPAGGNLIDPTWFRIYEKAPAGEGVVITQSWDPATSTAAESDYSVCTTWATYKEHHYLLHVWRGRLNFPDLTRKVIELQQEFGAERVLIEAVGIGLSLCQELDPDDDMFASASAIAPIRVVPKGDKVARMEAQTAKIERGDVLLPREAPWLAELMRELTAFPYGRHDDQVDSISQFLSRPGVYQETELAIGGERMDWWGAQFRDW